MCKRVAWDGSWGGGGAAGSGGEIGVALPWASRRTRNNAAMCSPLVFFDSTVCNRARAQAVGGAVAGPVMGRT